MTRRLLNDFDSHCDGGVSELEIVDAHVTIGQSELLDTRVTGDVVIKCLDENGIDAALAMPKPLSANPRSDHDEIARAARDNPGRIFGIASINPLRFGVREATDEIERCIKDLHFIAVNIDQLDWYLPAHSKTAELIIEKAEQLGVAVICIAGCGATAQPQYVGYAARKHPETHFVLGHIAPGDDRHTTILTILEHDNISVEISRCHVYEFRDVIRAVGPSRVLFGSDMQGMSWIEAVYLYMIRKHGLPPDQERLVLSENAKRIFRLSTEV